MTSRTTGAGRTTRIAAYGLLCDQQRILLCRISPQIPQLAGRWTLPGGGREFGEHPEAAMIREVRKETGWRVVVRCLAGVDSLYLKRDEGEFHSIRLLFHADVVGGTLTREINGTGSLPMATP